MPHITRVAARAALALIAGLATTAGRAAIANDPSQSRLVPVKLRVNQRESKLVYSIAVHYGPKRLEAALDTGSMPPLVLNGRVPAHDAEPTRATYSITYGADRSYASNVVQEPVRIGSESGTIAFGIVSSVSCVPQGSTCPISGEGPHDALFGGLYPAIVGARITTESGGRRRACEVDRGFLEHVRLRVGPQLRLGRAMATAFSNRHLHRIARF